MIVIDTAIAEARALGHNYVGTEHLLVALVQHRDLLPNQVGRMLPTEVQAVRAGAPPPPPVHVDTRQRNASGSHAPRQARDGTGAVGGHAAGVAGDRPVCAVAGDGGRGARAVEPAAPGSRRTAR